MKLILLLLFIATVYGIDVARFSTIIGRGAVDRFGTNSITNGLIEGSNGSNSSSGIRNNILNLAEQSSSARIELMAEDDDEPKTELGKKLREHLDEILEKIKDAIEHGKAVKEEWLEKAKDIRAKLKDMREEIGKKARELIEKIKEEGKNYLKQILEKLGLN